MRTFRLPRFARGPSLILPLAVVLTASTALAQKTANWNKMPGKGKDVGIGPDGKPWVISAKSTPGGFKIFRWTGSQWKKLPGAGVRIDVGPKGRAWVVDDQQRIFRFDGENWNQIPGRANDIGVGANGQTWAIGTNPDVGGYDIYRWDMSRWTKVGGSAERIDVDRYGQAWVVNKTKDIYRFDGGRWILVPGKAEDIGVGADGSVWILSVDTTKGGHVPMRWTGDGWRRYKGGLTSISVDPKGNPYGTDSKNRIWRGRVAPGKKIRTVLDRRARSGSMGGGVSMGDEGQISLSGDMGGMSGPMGAQARKKARARTQRTPSAPSASRRAKVRWVPQTSFKAGSALIGGNEPGRDLVLCRARFGGQMHPGKVVDGRCNIAAANREQRLGRYDVLIVDSQAQPRWSRFGSRIPSYAITAGRYAVCRARVAGGLHPGKTDGRICRIGFGGNIVRASQFQVLLR